MLLAPRVARVARLASTTMYMFINSVLRTTHSVHPVLAYQPKTVTVFVNMAHYFLLTLLLALVQRDFDRDLGELSQDWPNSGINTTRQMFIS